MNDIRDRLLWRADSAGDGFHSDMIYRDALKYIDMLQIEIKRLREVVLLGVNARKCQVTYFKTRNRDALLVSKNAERAFDDAARAVLAGEATDDAAT